MLKVLNLDQIYKYIQLCSLILVYNNLRMLWGSNKKVKLSILCVYPRNNMSKTNIHST